MKHVSRRKTTEVQEVDTGDRFHRQIMQSTHSFGPVGVCSGCGARRGSAQAGRRCSDSSRMPRVKVIIQVRHDVPTVGAYRAKMAQSIRGFRKRGVPEDERPEILEAAMNQGDSREWTDVEVFWDGRYDPADVKLPAGEDLERIEDAYGAAEARVRVRAQI